MNPAPGPAEESEDLNLGSDDMAFMQSLLGRLAAEGSEQANNGLESLFDEVLDGAEDSLMADAQSLNFAGPEAKNTLRYMLTLNFAEKIFREYLARKEKQAEEANPPYEWTRDDRVNMLKEKLEFIVGEEVESWNSETQKFPFRGNILSIHIERRWGFCPPLLWRFESEVENKDKDYRDPEHKARPDEIRVLWKDIVISSISLEQLKETPVPIFDNLIEVAHQHVLSWFTHDQFAKLRDDLKDDFPNLYVSLTASEEWSRARTFNFCKKLVAERTSLGHLDIIVQTLLEHSPGDPFQSLLRQVRIALAPHTSRPYRKGMTLPVATLTSSLEKKLKARVQAGHPICRAWAERLIWNLRKCQLPLLVSDNLRAPLIEATQSHRFLTEDDIPNYVSIEYQRVIHLRGVRTTQKLKHLSRSLAGP